MDGFLTPPELLEVLRPLLARELAGYGFALVVESPEPDGSTRVDFVSNRDRERLALMLRRLAAHFEAARGGRVSDTVQ